MLNKQKQFWNRSNEFKNFYTINHKLASVFFFNSTFKVPTQFQERWKKSNNIIGLIMEILPLCLCPENLVFVFFTLVIPPLSRGKKCKYWIWRMCDWISYLYDLPAYHIYSKTLKARVREGQVLLTNIIFLNRYLQTYPTFFLNFYICVYTWD